MTVTNVTPTARPCPSWCELTEHHWDQIDRGLLNRTHTGTVHVGTDLAVTITADEDMTRGIVRSGIDYDVAPDILSAEQAREFAGLLLRAADTIEG